MARNIYLAVRNDSTATAEIRTAHSELATAMATDRDASFDLTSSTVNGQSFAGVRNMTNAQRFNMLSLVVSMLDEAEAVSNESFPKF